MLRRSFFSSRGAKSNGAFDGVRLGVQEKVNGVASMILTVVDLGGNLKLRRWQPCSS